MPTAPHYESFTQIVAEARQVQSNQAQSDAADQPTLLIPVVRSLFADTLTPVTAYRRLVHGDSRLDPSFLFESVVGGDRVGRFSYMSHQPAIEIIARRNDVTYRDHREPANNRSYAVDDPMGEMEKVTDPWKLIRPEGLTLPEFTGGWVGNAGYDVVRYLEPEKLNQPPADDRNLPDLHMQLYLDLVAFDHVQKTILVVSHAVIEPQATEQEQATAYESAKSQVDRVVDLLQDAPSSTALPLSDVSQTRSVPQMPVSNMGEGGYQQAVLKCKEYIAAGDAFQIVPSQRFEFKTHTDPFDIYRSLRVVNPSPYMFYLQIEGAILIGSSPEILCRVKDGIATSRPLAGTRKRGHTEQEDQALEADLRSDPKDVAEHVMLVDLHRNDIGRVAQPGTIDLTEVLIVERYSHVMHLSSEVQGQVKAGMNCWDALRVSLPVGTVSGAPKVRAMQIIDELEPTRRGPYGGAVGHVDLEGNMDMAIALRTMVVTPSVTDDKASQWTVHIQAGGGIVADSEPDAEFTETVNKAAALAQAVALAESNIQHE